MKRVILPLEVHTGREEDDDDDENTSSLLTLCVDTREDVHFRQRIKRRCEQEGIPVTERELPAGDYIFLQDRYQYKTAALPPYLAHSRVSYVCR